MRQEMGSHEFHQRLKAYLGDDRNASLKASSRRGKRKQRGARPLNLATTEGIPDPTIRQSGLPHHKALRGVFTEEDEMTRRRELRKKALTGDEDALAQFRNGERVRTLMLDGKLLINDGILVGARPR